MIGLEWQLTREGLLAREVDVLEAVAAEKTELLARLTPVPPSSAVRWLELPDDSADDGAAPEQVPGSESSEGTQAVGLAGVVGAGHAGQAVDEADGEAGALPELNAQHISESYTINLEVRVLQVRGASAVGRQMVPRPPILRCEAREWGLKLQQNGPTGPGEGEFKGQRSVACSGGARLPVPIWRCACVHECVNKCVWVWVCTCVHVCAVFPAFNVLCA